VGSRDLPSPKTTQNTSFFIWSQSIKAVTGPAGVEILVPAPVHHVGHAYKHHIITVAHLRGNHGNTHVRKSHRTRPFPHGLKQTCFSPIGLKPSVKPVVWLHTRKAIRWPDTGLDSSCWVPSSVSAHLLQYVAYVDLKLAFYSVDQSALWLALQGIDTPDTVLNLLRDLHSGTGARIRRRRPTTASQQHPESDRGVSAMARQNRAPTLFCRALDWIMEHMSGLKGVTLCRYTVTNLDYADDIALPASQLPDLKTCLSGFSVVARTMGLNVSWLTTKVQCFDLGGAPSDVIIEGNSVESCYCYLGVQDSSGKDAREICCVG